MAGGTATTTLGVLLLVCFATWASATDHTVGGSSGWKLGADYATWANGETFVVGDNLVFNYAAGGHTVSEVNEGDYSACSTSNALSSDSSGSTKIPLKTAGKHFFVCGISGHCDGGMKLAINVVDSSTNSTSPSPVTTNSTSSGAVALSSPAYATTVALLGTTALVLKLGTLFKF